MDHLSGNETMKQIRGIIKSNDFLNDIKTAGKGRNKQRIIKDINHKIDALNALNDNQNEKVLY